MRAQNPNNEFLRKVFGWMVFGLLVSALAAYASITEPAINAFLLQGWVFWTLIIAEFLVVVLLAAAIDRMSPQAATAFFLLYSFLTGLTISVILLAYSITTVGYAFFTAAGMFAAAAALGYYTKKDLGGLGLFLFMMLIGLIIASIISLFVQSSGFSLVLNYLAVIIFAGLTVYDVNRIKKQRLKGDAREKAAIIGALALYLNFINMFLALLHIFDDN